jgi:CubicO group peptidase (beta-lactamase class C family)
MARRAALITTLLALLLAAPAQAAKQCEEPGNEWTRATPAEAGMDAARLQEAMDYASTQASFAARVYRWGCLVAEDRAAPLNRNQEYESWSMAKSVTSMVFGRALSLGLVSPNDPVGSLVPEADPAHGRIALRDLLTMTSGLRWNGLRDYNIFTMEDRVRDALTLEPVHPPGTYYEYAQSPVTLLGEAVARAVGDDFEFFAERELMTPIGIAPTSWRWTRDRANHPLAFMGVVMRPDDFARLGELMRRGGTWRGRRLLSTSYVRRAITPSKTNGCYGWLIWVNAGAPCVGPTVQTRPISEEREFPDLPGDMYHFAGLFGQLVTVFPSQGIVIVRTGQDPGLAPSGGAGWEHELYRKVLAAVVDQEIPPPGPPTQAQVARPNHDYGFGQSLAEPDQYSKGSFPDQLPPPGPALARAPELRVLKVRRRSVRVRVGCPARSPSGAHCAGRVRLKGKARRYDLAPGQSRKLRLRVRKARGKMVTARNSQALGGAWTKRRVR